MKRTVEKLTWHIWILLGCWTDFSTSTDDSCRIPEITSNLSMFVYQRTATVNVEVYHCLYLENITCDRDVCCKYPGNKRAYPDVKTSTYKYSDISQRCLKAFATTQFEDKYGHSHEYKKTNTDSFECPNKANVHRTTSVLLTHYNASANIAQDQILLKSGTTCKYTSGFCHDGIEDVDVIWGVERDWARYEWRRFNVSDLYFLVLNRKRYAIIESLGKYYVLKLKNPTQNTWETQYESLTVSTTVIEHASNEDIEMIDHLELSFEDKQDMYDFIAETCIADTRNLSTSQYLSSFVDRAFLTSLKMKRQEHRWKELSGEYHRLKFRLTIYFYMINLFACLVMFLVYFTFNKYFNVTIKRVPDCSKSVANDRVYSYITSDYDRNSI